MFYTDDPVEDYARWDAEQQRRLKKNPVCSYCEEHVQEDYFYLINDEVVCVGCLEAFCRKSTDDYLGW